MTRHKNILIVGLAAVFGAMLMSWVEHDSTWKILSRLVWLPILVSSQNLYDEILNLGDHMYGRRLRSVKSAIMGLVAYLAMLLLADGAWLNRCGHIGPGQSVIALWFYLSALTNIVVSWQLGLALTNKYRRPWLRALSITLSGSAAIGLVAMHRTAPQPERLGWWLEIGGAVMIASFYLNARRLITMPTEESLPLIRLDLTKALCLLAFAMYIAFFPFAAITPDPKLAALPTFVVGWGMLAYAASAYRTYQRIWRR